MTTNMSEFCNSMLKGAPNLPITALVQLTFYRVNNYFTIRQKHGASRLASGEEFTPYVDAKIKARFVKGGSHEVLLYDHVQEIFHVKTRHTVGSNRKPHSYHVNLRMGLAHIPKHYYYDSHCSHVLSACHCRLTWTPLFSLIFDEFEWPKYD